MSQRITQLCCQSRSCRDDRARSRHRRHPQLRFEVSSGAPSRCCQMLDPPNVPISRARFVRRQHWRVLVLFFLMHDSSKRNRSHQAISLKVSKRSMLNALATFMIVSIAGSERPAQLPGLRAVSYALPDPLLPAGSAAADGSASGAAGIVTSHA